MKFLNSKAIFFFAFFLTFISAFSQNRFEHKCEENSELKATLKKIVCTLSNDSMEGRAAGSEGEKKAKNYLLHYLENIGFKEITTQSFSFLRDSVRLDTAYNIIARINNKADSTIIFGAHYDHIGFGGPKSRSLTNKKIHNGADDNASGVALMLLLAGNLLKSSQRKFNYIFVGFSAHEDGLFGSEDFLTQKKEDLSKTKLMLNFDMVGRLDTANPVLKIIRSEKAICFDSLLKKVNHSFFNLKFDETGSSKTDASAFENRGNSTITFTTGTHDDYHKISDDPEKINFEGIFAITNYLENFILSLPKEMGR